MQPNAVQVILEWAIVVLLAGVAISVRKRRNILEVPFTGEWACPDCNAVGAFVTTNYPRHRKIAHGDEKTTVYLFQPE